MEPFAPVTRRRPTLTSDGEGGFTESGDVEDTDITVYGAFRLHQNQVQFVFDSQNDLKVNDYIIGETHEESSSPGTYRIMEIVTNPGQEFAIALLERRDSPIRPQ